MKCEASDELTTSTFLMPDWYSWLIRWNTRSDPDRSTSIWIFGYSARKALAINSATLTSIDEYHTTLPSLAAAASIAGVVSWPAAGAAIAQASSAIGNVLMPQFHLIHLMRVSFFPIVFHLFARYRSVKRRVSVISSDSRALAPDSLRERDLARCSQRIGQVPDIARP